MKDGHGLRAILDDDLRARAHSRHQRGKVARRFRLGDVDHIFSHVLIIHRFLGLNGGPEDCVLRITSRTRFLERCAARRFVWLPTCDFFLLLLPHLLGRPGKLWNPAYDEIYAEILWARTLLISGEISGIRSSVKPHDRAVREVDKQGVTSVYASDRLAGAKFNPCYRLALHLRCSGNWITCVRGTIDLG